MNENTPVDFDKLFDATSDTEAVVETEQETEEVEIPTTESVEEEVEQVEQEDPNAKYLEAINEWAKDAKINHELGYKFGTKEEFLTTVQKGLNYDKLSESKVMKYTENKAKELGMTPTQYIEAVEQYEMKQKEEEYNSMYNEFIEQGMSEDIAKKAVEGLKVKDNIKVDVEKEKKEKEVAEFVQEFPDVEYSKIPKEVLESPEPLSIAYRKYENKILKQELEQVRKTQANKTTSPVRPITTTGAVEDEGEDVFMQGFNS